MTGWVFINLSGLQSKMLKKLIWDHCIWLMCVLCKIDKACQDINYLKFDKCVEIIEFSNRQSRAISLPAPHPLQTEVFVQPLNDAALSLQHTACKRLKLVRGSQRSTLCCCSGDTNINPWDTASGMEVAESEETTGRLSQHELFTGETGGRRRLPSTTSLLPPLPLHRWDKKLTAAPVSGRMVLQNCLSQQTYLFQLIAESF